MIFINKYGNFAMIYRISLPKTMNMYEYIISIGLTEHVAIESKILHNKGKTKVSIVWYLSKNVEPIVFRWFNQN